MLTMLIIALVAIPTARTESQILNLDKEPTITYIKLYEVIVSMGIKFPDIVFAQAVLETGNFKSRLARINNNLFGMKLARVRETTAIGKSKSGYAKYESWIHSVEDYSYWQQFTIKDKDISRKEYLNLLSDIYATDKTYVSQLNRKIKQYRHIMD